MLFYSKKTIIIQFFKNKIMKNLTSNLILATFLSLFIFLTTKVSIYYFPIIFLSSFPWKLGKNIYSLFGGFNDEGSVYSFLGIIQIAKKNAKSIFSLSVLQKANKRCKIFAGISFLQTAGISSEHYLGISIKQKAQTNCRFWFGIILKQEAKKNNAILIGLGFKQKAEKRSYIGFGGVVKQEAEKTALTWNGAKRILKKN